MFVGGGGGGGGATGEKEKVFIPGVLKLITGDSVVYIITLPKLHNGETEK